MEEKITNIMCTLVTVVEAAMTDVSSVDTHEMGEVIDMIKDLSQTLYYLDTKKEGVVAATPV